MAQKSSQIKNIRVHIVAGFIHRDICERMVTAARAVAKELDVMIADITWIPGSLEAPLAVQTIIERKRPDAIVVFGVLVRGKTKHGEVIAHAVTKKLLDLQCEYQMPLAIAIIGPNASLTHATGKAAYTAEKALRAAVHMVHLARAFHKKG